MLDYDSETRIKPLEAIHHPFFRKEGSFLPPSLPIDLTHAIAGGSQPFYPPVTQTHGSVTSQEPMIISQEIVSLDANQPYHSRQPSELISGRHIKMRYSPPPPSVFLPNNTNNDQSGLQQSVARTNPYPVPMNIGHPVPVCLPNHLSPQHSATSSYSPKFGTHYSNNSSYRTESSSSSKLHPLQQNGSSLPQTFYGTNALFNDPNDQQQFSFSFSPSQQPHLPPSSQQPHPSHHVPYSTTHRTNHHHTGSNVDHTVDHTVAVAGSGYSNNHSTGKSYQHRRTKGQSANDKGDSPMMGVVIHR